MGTLNYKHPHYFWAVDKAGGVTRASERLHVTPQTISGQLRLFEEVLGKRCLLVVGGISS
ncbi:MAG: LysR family transcriptional regulator [Sulfuricella sp.]|nr:LysR family transcriptional regulator [Sulfuricella sp.]